MNEQQRIAAFKRALDRASARYGVRLAVATVIGNVELAAPVMVYVPIPLPTPSNSIDVSAEARKEMGQDGDLG